jgi:dihydropteroate synthase
MHPLNQSEDPAERPHAKPAFLVARGRSLTLGPDPLLMGIVNINDDSFSGDGRIDPAWALERSRELADQGADIIDLGAESARTNRPPISEEEEVRRLLPVVTGFARAFEGRATTPLLSINTWRPGVVEKILPLGGDLLNDMGGLPDDRNARLCARHGAALLIMHSVGEPKVSHDHITYPDILETLAGFFEEKIRLATAAGLPRDSIILDPGLDFAKQTDDSLVILRHLEALRGLGLPILLPISRKSFIGSVLGIDDPSLRDPGTAACLVAGMLGGASLFRVHNLKMARAVLATVSAVIRNSPGSSVATD